MKRTLIGAAIAGAAILAVPAAAQMMGGYGPGYGPGYGMHGGYGPGYGMGPGMMWGYGGGYGPMHGYGPRGYGYGIPDLTSEQRSKIAGIEEGFRKKQWALMESMHGASWHQDDFYRGGQFDEGAARKAFDEMTALRKQMFENSLELRKGIDSVLTQKQREQLRGGR